MVWLLRSAEALIGDPLVWRDHRRAAKKRARAIEYARVRPNRVPHYRELIKLTRAILAADQAAAQLSQAPDPATAPWQAEFRHYRPLIEQIIGQTERRVLRRQRKDRQPVRAARRHHRQSSRKVEYGHKLNLTTGRSGLILDLVIEAGNPADSERFLPMLERHIAFHGEAPTGSRRRRLRQPSQSQPGEGPRRPRLGLPQESRPNASRTWSRATGSIASCATSGPA